MDRVIVAVFHDDERAREGNRALDELHTEGTITLYATAMLVEDSAGKAALTAPAELSGTYLGMLAGALMGALGSSAAAAAGAASGAMVGAATDVGSAGLGADFLQEIAEQLAPRKAALVAEIDEDWQIPLDIRLEALGGTVFRRARIDLEDAYVEREIAADKAELAALKAEYARTSAERQAKLQAKIDTARRKLQDKHDRVADRVKALKREGEAKMASVKEQAARAKGETKATLEQRLAEVRADYQARAAKLNQSWESMKSTLAA